MRTREVIIIGFCISLLLIVNISALYIQEDNQISFGHPLRVQSVNAPDLSPGETGILKVNLRNNAAYVVTDVRSKLTLPSQLQFINDVNEVRIAEIKSNETKEVEYRIIALPTTTEGIYSSSLLINYVSHYGVNAFNVGEDNSDNYSFGIVVKSIPSMFVQVDSADIYKEKMSGDLTLKFVNNGTSNIKFLTVNLGPSGDYDILSDNRYYVGDLDSNDYQTVVFKLRVNAKSSEVNIPLTLSYRDSMNNEYSEKSFAKLNIVDGSELGKTSGVSPIAWVIIIIIVIIIVYFVYKRIIRKRKSKNY
jgi:hypothetical protein